jgi:hypothetical protein
MFRIVSSRRRSDRLLPCCAPDRIAFTSTVMSRTSRPMFTWIGMTVRQSSGWSLLRLRTTWGFSARELRRIEEIVAENRQQLREAWRGYFGT